MADASCCSIGLAVPRLPLPGAIGRALAFGTEHVPEGRSLRVVAIGGYLGVSAAFIQRPSFGLSWARFKVGGKSTHDPWLGPPMLPGPLRHSLYGDGLALSTSGLPRRCRMTSAASPTCTGQRLVSILREEDGFAAVVVLPQSVL